MTLLVPNGETVTRASHSPAHILVVDDEPAIAESLRDYLLNLTDCHVAVAYDGEEAQAQLLAALDAPSGPFDLVLLDMRLPGMSGQELLAWMRGHPVFRYTRVVILTATSGAQERVLALSAGADDYITKPYHPQELLARVSTMLRSHQLEKQLQQQSRQLAMLNQVSSLMTTMRQTNMVFDTAVQGARRILDVTLAAIFMVDEGENQLQCRQLSLAGSRIPNYQPIPVGQGLIGQAFTASQPLCLNAPTSDSRYRPHLDTPADFPLQNILAAPLVIRRRPIGVLVAANQRHRSFSEVDIDLFSSLATSVSRAIENAWLFQSVRQRQQKLLESRNRLQAVIDGILHPIYTVNDQWQVLSLNQTKASELQKSASEIIGQTCYQIFFGRDTPCERCSVARTLRYQEASRWSVRWIGADHLPREWDVIAYPISDQQAELGQAVVVWEDITEERRLEYSLIQAGKLAAIGQLAAGVAHEINNPLTVVSASSAMLKMAIAQSDENYELVDLIAQAGERAAKVVRGLLDYARQEEYDFAELDVNESLLQALNLVSYQLQTANIDIVQELGQDLPPVFASGDHLKTVWINLFINARDALLAREEERKLELVTRLAPEGEQVQILVRDNGKGMSQAELEHIFEPFFTTKDPGKGTGLGLSTSHRIIEQHAGEIEVVSSPGEGTTFIVRLPTSGE